MANEKRLIDASAMKHQLECHIARAIHWGVENIPMGKDSSSAFEFLRGYERGATETANIALGQPQVDAVEVVHGRFVDGLCTICDWFGDCTDTPYYNYCPNCGAKMDGGNEDV